MCAGRRLRARFSPRSYHAARRRRAAGMTYTDYGITRAIARTGTVALSVSPSTGQLTGGRLTGAITDGTVLQITSQVCGPGYPVACW